MEDNDIEQITKLASEFRKAIIKSNLRSLSIGMQGFQRVLVVLLLNY